MTLQSKDSSSKEALTCRINFKRLFNKIKPSKQKLSKKKENVEKEIVRNNENQLELDALPDFPRRDSELSHQSASDSIIDNNFEDTDPKSQHDTYNEKPPMSEEKVEEEEEEEREDFTPNDNKENIGSGGPSSYVQHTNIVVNGGTGFHFGNVYSHVHVERYVHPEPQPEKQENKIPKTEAVRELMKCRDKIESAYLEFLAGHFGAKWRAIGLSLGLTNGELDALKEQFKKNREIGYQMLKVWWQMRGEGATVGELCKLLWEGGVASATEAVHKLSANIEHLK